MPSSGVEPARALVTLQRLLEIPAADLGSALTHACNALAEALAADKVDAFLYDESRDSLTALGTSTQSLSNLQKKLGLDVLPISNGGRVVQVYQTGEVFRTGDLQSDTEELRGVKEGLKIQSKLGVPLVIGGQRRGMVMIASLNPDQFSEADEAFTVSAARWVGIVAHRAELIQEIGKNAVEQGRRSAAEELIAVLAHDVRNYIAPIAGRLYLLRHGAESRGDLQEMRHAEAGLRGVNGLSALVTNLLDVARIDRGLFALDIEPVDLGVLAREAGGMLSSAEHEIIVKATGSILVAADRARLRQCLDNLLSNAASHSPRGAPVNVFVAQYDSDGTSWGQLEVIDEGPGVPEDLLPHIFDRFISGRTEKGGVGLGLYIASRIAQAHRGHITAESPPGQGARFILRIPLYVENAPAE
jgi:two-component system, OmpR family, sensor kinase